MALAHVLDHLVAARECARAHASAARDLTVETFVRWHVQGVDMPAQIVTSPSVVLAGCEQAVKFGTGR